MVFFNVPIMNLNFYMALGSIRSLGSRAPCPSASGSAQVPRIPHHRLEEAVALDPCAEVCVISNEGFLIDIVSPHAVLERRDHSVLVHRSVLHARVPRAVEAAHQLLNGNRIRAVRDVQPRVLHNGKAILVQLAPHSVGKFRERNRVRAVCVKKVENFLDLTVVQFDAETVEARLELVGGQRVVAVKVEFGQLIPQHAQAE
mmetsp:Transcript_10410/g.27458  ORF Transcript_10410/g.27458 Transcript_10410/m.27458 type:complete len:201 (-) Transcript_10410:4581-5183(-)